MTEHLKKWLEFKYRTRRVCYKDKISGKSIKEYRTAQKDINDSLDGPKHFYTNLVTQFEKTLDRNGIIDGNFLIKKVVEEE
jgi:hypothetical protein